MTEPEELPRTGWQQESSTDRLAEPGVDGLESTIRKMLPVLKRPVDDILGHTAALMRPELPADVSARILDIQESSLRLSRVVDALSLFACQTRVPFSVVQPNRIAEEAVSLVEYQFRRSGAAVFVSTAPDLPDTTGNAALLKQALIALLTNALDSLENWSGPRDVSVSTLKENGWVAFRVTDTGPGMSDDARRKAFDPFFSTRRGAAGLGLSLVHGIAGLHHGTVELEDVKTGTSVLLRLPVRSVDDLDPEESAVPVAKRRILVVDDEPLVLDVISEMLGSLGYDVECVMSSASGFDLLDRENYDAVFVDYFMPDMNGLAFVDQVRRGGTLQQMAILTGDATTDGVRTLSEERNLPILEKPFSFEDLKLTLRRIFAD